MFKITSAHRGNLEDAETLVAEIGSSNFSLDDNPDNDVIFFLDSDNSLVTESSG